MIGLRADKKNRKIEIHLFVRLGVDCWPRKTAVLQKKHLLRAGRDGRTVFVDADSRYAGRDRPDVTDGIDGDLHRFTESLGRDVFRPQTISTARYPKISGIGDEACKGRPTIFQIGWKLLKWLSILVTLCQAYWFVTVVSFFYLFPWCLLICLCGIVLICSVMSLLFVPVTSFDLSLRCRFDLSLGGVWPNSQVEPRMKWGGCPFPTHWLLAKVFFLLIFSSKVFHRQYWQKIASSFFSFLIGSLKEPINLNIFFDALTY